MINKLKWGAKVISKDGKEVGKLLSIVMYPNKKKITHIVVEKGFFNRREKLVPVENIIFAEKDEVRINVESGAMDQFKDFESIQFIEGENDNENITPIYWYRPVDAYTELYPLPLYGAKQNIPKGQEYLEEGSYVFSVDEEELGYVKSLICNDEGNITHIAIDTRQFSSKGDKLIPVDWIKKIKECKVILSMTSKFVEDLPEYE
ncbi:MAG: hypothetical protein PWQ77_1699 [Kosmotogales bacterium]|nr:hypothetical protein [Kosmotogales bacterium]